MSNLGWKYLTADDKSAILRGVRDGVAYGGPFHAEIHPSDRCNIDCFFCSTASLRGTDEVALSRLEEMIGELKALGTRSVRLAGGGEPLFHRKTKDLLRAIFAAGLPIENITTNAVLLLEEVSEILIDGQCDQITVSLNTADPESYARMMQTPGRNFERVVANVRNLIAQRRRRNRQTPKINLQFLVWKENYRTLPKMYALARELDVDTIFFNGLAFLKPEQKMSADDTREMMRLYEEIVRVDEYRRISIIESYEQDIRPQVAEMNARLHAERNARGRVARLTHLVTRRDLSWKEKMQHRRKLAVARQVERESAGLDEPCVIGWHSLLIRTGGIVAPCCILQGSELGDVFKQPLRDIWYGEPYVRFRRELARIIEQGSSWKHDPGDDRTVVPMCGGKGGTEVCPIRSDYYKSDIPFLRELNATSVRARS